MTKWMLATMALAFAAAPAAASADGTVEGRVTDKVTGKPVQGATVTMKAPNWISQWVTTDSHGRYTITLLPPGHYTLTVVAPGYSEVETDDVQVHADHTLRDNAVMPPARVASAGALPALATAGEAGGR